jgi:hypothetical protein
MAAVLLGIAGGKQGKMGVLASFAAGLLASSAASGCCAVYSLLGISTAGESSRAEKSGE